MRLVLKYHKFTDATDPEAEYRVVGFEVQPASIDYNEIIVKDENGKKTCSVKDDKNFKYQEVKEGNLVQYSLCVAKTISVLRFLRFLVS